MATVSIPYTFVNGSQNADATQVNSNFSTLASFLNTEVIQRDASVAFTQIPTLPSTTPTNANHATRKGYVDSFFPVTSANIADGAIVNADVNASAAIAYSKLALTNSIVNADVSATAAIAYSKLNLAGTLVAADFAAAAKPIVICTSTTRPTTGVVEGQLIYETDTDRIYVATAATPTWQLVHGEVAATGTRTAGLAIANGGSPTLTYTAETDPDGLLSTGTGIFTAPHTGLYACTINVSVSSGSMADGFGSTITLQNVGWRNQLLGSETTVSLITRIAATNTVTWQITNATGGTLTYIYSAEWRWIGR